MDIEKVEQPTTLPAGKIDYPEEFEAIWLCFIETEKLGLGKRGYKKEAYNDWLANHGPLQEMIDALREQARHKMRARAKGERFDPFKHACRWFKYRCWEDEVIEEDTQLIKQQASETTREKVQERLNDLNSRDWAN